MRSYTFSLLLALGSACQPSCPPTLVEEAQYEGEGFLITHEPANSFVVFYPACAINSQHYLTSLTAHNLGQGVNLPLYDLRYASAILKTAARLKLTEYSTDQYAYQGIYIVPVRIKFRNLAYGSPLVTYPVHYVTDKVSITTPYARAYLKLDTLVMLPYAP
ncbi:hypothetical protein GCM10011378_41930 [Hymenobacter glacieicola]|uniref:Lipoprotein n=1 Tax=Hymenobacter glacieicola TaxID=1562124 RepID=A0ABQ1X5Y8_9BACT|nr:hypothetical protein GCM10011378_41930 [Hymenobacter glacieicola]